MPGRQEEISGLVQAGVEPEHLAECFGGAAWLAEGRHRLAEGWLGEIEGLRVSLAGANDKLAQIDRRTGGQTTVDLGFPATPGKQ
ncbi:hypothetical protein [Nonomuraea basaltis]|uniref:hypothetical protein n=1 Tax=Nonomuraea basaltis TaxID=2495887 RepID=UPI001485FD30|nr:hypothetical protein [Nonomuraea basaltis]